MSINKTCPKCRDNYCSPRYKKETIFGFLADECLEYKCLCCGYSWCEPCKDSKEIDLHQQDVKRANTN